MKNERIIFSLLAHYEQKQTKTDIPIVDGEKTGS